MDEALGAATIGLGRTGTNPLVGACLSKDGQILATAGHEKLGGDHAERRLFSQFDGSADGTTLAVTLEPCLQPGRTPACLPLIVESAVEKIIIATVDPHPGVEGNSLEALQRLGYSPKTDVLRREYRWLSRAYFHRQSTGLPWVELKSAVSADGYLATPNRRSQWITGEESRDKGHRLRSRVDAVMVGAGTLRDDNPRLTDRVTDRDGQPKAIVVARSSDGIAPSQTLFDDRSDATILVVPPNFSESVLEDLRSAGVSVLVSDLYRDRFDWKQVLARLARTGIGRILVEGGAILGGSLLQQNVVNELHWFYSGRIFGNGIPSLKMERDPFSVEEAPVGKLLDIEQFGEDVYVRRILESTMKQEDYREIEDHWVAQF